MLSITQHKGFRMTFENGWTVSVQFGPGNYCEVQHKDYNAPSTSALWNSQNAEVAAWDKDGKWYSFGSDDVAGWLTADEVVEFVAQVKAF